MGTSLPFARESRDGQSDRRGGSSEKAFRLPGNTQNALSGEESQKQEGKGEKVIDAARQKQMGGQLRRNKKKQNAAPAQIHPKILLFDIIIQCLRISGW